MATSEYAPVDSETELHALLGRFFVSFATVEFNLSLRAGGAGSFREKVERWLDIALEQCDGDDDICDVLTWCVAANSLRTVRNRLAHGRWAYLPRQRHMVHVSAYPPQPQDERYFSCSDFDEIIQDAAAINLALIALRA